MSGEKFRLFNFRKLTAEEKQKILDDFFGESQEYSRFYNLAGTLYRIVEFLFLFVFIIFLIVSALGNLTGISYSNAEYIIRNFALEFEANKSVSTELVYNPDSEMDFAMFSGGLSVCGNTGVSIFSATGTRTLQETVDIVSPVIRASEKYTLVFENAGSEYYIYNRFSRVYTGYTDYPVTNAYIADNGYYVIVSNADGYTSAAFVYDADFSLVNRFLINGFITSASLDDSGKKFVMSSVNITDDGRYICEILRVTVGEETAEAKKTYYDILPLCVRFADNAVYTLCADRLIVNGFDGNDSEIFFREGSTEAFCVSENKAFVLLGGIGNGNGCILLTAVTDGSFVENEFSAVYCSMDAADGRTFLLTEKGILYSDGDSLVSYNTDKPFSSDSRLLALNTDCVYICNKSCAYLIKVD